MRFEILIAKDLLSTGVPSVYLDTFEEESISLNFNIADITDISSKNSSYSKTIKLPDTGRNRKAFSEIFNVEATSPYWSTRPFNPNKKVACIILGDTLEIFRGNLQLTNISYDFDGNRHSYDVVVYSDNDSLFKVIGEQYLSDLDLSRFDHTYTIENIEKSWGLNGGNGDYTDGYFYPLIDYGFPLYYPDDSQTNPISIDKLYTGFYVKTIFDQIITEAGFSYTSEFLNNYRFVNLITPFNNKTFRPSPTLITGADNLIFLATKSTTYSLPNRAHVSPEFFGQYYYGSFQCNVDEFDPNNLYNNTSHYYENSPTESYKQNFTLHFKLQVQTVPGFNTVWVDSTDDIRIWCKRSKDANGVTNPAWSDTPTYDQLYNPSDPNYFRDILIDGGQGISLRNTIGPEGGLTVIRLPTSIPKWTIEGQCTTDWVDKNALLPGEQVRFFITRRYTGPLPPQGGPFRPAMNVTPGTFVYGTLDPTTAVIGSNISIKDVIPTKVKQKDFLISIFKMFNLYIEPSKELQNNFIIEPRDEYYKLYQVAKDWSQKLDLDKPITSDILSNLQKRTNTFTYKTDKDVYNTNYTTNTNEIFGQFRFEIDNDFIGDENKIETVFSPTPIDELSPKGSGFYLPIITNLNNGNAVKSEGMNIRILFRQLLTVTKPFLLMNEDFSQQYSYTFYPFVGHTDDPINPRLTLNFGSISPFYSGYVETQNNLFNSYYRNQITELNDEGSRLITANFNLNSYDINQFRFSDLIYFTINGMSDWYRVTKIMDYDPTSELSTKVQLIKAYNYTIPFDGMGLTPSVEFCEINMERTLIYDELVELLAVIGSYANSEFPILTFYNTYENVGYSLGPVSESIGIGDIESWVQSSGPTGLSLTFNPSNATETFSWKINVPCNTGPYSFLIGMGDEINSLNNIQPIFSTPYVDCICDNLFLRSPYTEAGLRNVISTDNIYVGVLNTSTSNITSLPNVAMVGENNVVSNVGVMTIGDSNSGLGQNSLLVGESNQNTGRQSLVVGDTNIVNGKNTFALGSNNLVSSPQSFVVGYGNQLLNQEPESYTYSTPGTSSVFGTYSQPGTQSAFIIGNNNTSLSNTGFIYGSNNLIGVSASNAIIFGNNNDIGFTSSGPSGSNLDSVFIVGNNITLTQSTPNLFYVGYDTVEFNTQNFITNITGTSSFNKATIAQLTLDDVANDLPGNLKIQQRGSTFPNNSYLETDNNGPGLALVYYDLDGGGPFTINRTGTSSVEYLSIGEGLIVLASENMTLQTTNLSLPASNITLQTPLVDFGKSFTFSTDAYIFPDVHTHSYEFKAEYAKIYDNYECDGQSLNEYSFKRSDLNFNGPGSSSLALYSLTYSILEIEVMSRGLTATNLTYTYKGVAIYDDTQFLTQSTIVEYNNFGATCSVIFGVNSGNIFLTYENQSSYNIGWKFKIRQLFG